MSSLTVVVDVKPASKQLNALSDLLNAVDLLIVCDCFSSNNPMRESGSTVLFWDWATVTVGTLCFPTPIHTASKTESYLFTASNTEVLLSHKECACATAYFYLSHMFQLEHHWATINTQLPLMHRVLLKLAFIKLKGITKSKRSKILFALRSQLTDAGNSVLN